MPWCGGDGLPVRLGGGCQAGCLSEAVCMRNRPCPVLLLGGWVWVPWPPGCPLLMGVGLGLGVACCRGLGQYALVALLSGLTRCLLVLLLAGVWVWVVWVGWL